MAIILSTNSRKEALKYLDGLKPNDTETVDYIKRLRSALTTMTDTDFLQLLPKAREAALKELLKRAVQSWQLIDEDQ